MSRRKEPTSVDRIPEVAEQGEVPVEDAVVKPVKGRKKRHSGKKQAAERCEEPKELIRGICGSRMKLAAACRKMFHHATVAWHKRNIFRKIMTHGNGGQRKVTATGMKITRCAGHRRMGQNEDSIEQETPKRMEENRRKYSACSNGIRDKGLKQRLRGNKQMKDPSTNGPCGGVTPSKIEKKTSD
jgi:hypothetical protein